MNLYMPEAYLETCLSYLKDLLYENSWRLLAVNYFHKKALSKMFEWVLYKIEYEIVNIQ